MKRLGAVGQHTRALGRQRIERIRLGRGCAFAGRKTPVEAAKGHANGPGEQHVLRWRLYFEIFFVFIDGLDNIAASNRAGRSKAVGV